MIYVHFLIWREKCERTVAVKSLLRHFHILLWLPTQEQSNKLFVSWLVRKEIELGDTTKYGCIVAYLYYFGTSRLWAQLWNVWLVVYKENKFSIMSKKNMRSWDINFLGFVNCHIFFQNAYLEVLKMTQALAAQHILNSDVNYNYRSPMLIFLLFSVTSLLPSLLIAFLSPKTPFIHSFLGKITV